MSKTSIIGPYFFEDETVNQDNYLALFQDYFYSIFKKKRLGKKVIFQQGGAPPHFSKEVRAWLNIMGAQISRLNTS
jgi:hypothetical protein